MRRDKTVSQNKREHGVALFERLQNVAVTESFDGCPRTLSSFSFTDTLLRFDYCWVKFFISIDNLNRVGEGVEPELERGVPFDMLPVVNFK
ncbi:hypothetical protein L3X38_036409 [Prunus dulcis]|uniref:Uncharacterized protein n=1 Tax=Prunus dulcis TaxID=3755 RepID=A0AAD4YNJ2_PRUDU|nr:hypothetical protein L3X38_036409 [Prunus dulcis]